MPSELIQCDACGGYYDFRGYDHSCKPEDVTRHTNRLDYLKRNTEKALREVIKYIESQDEKLASECKTIVDKYDCDVFYSLKLLKKGV